ncbi:MAG: hypothetical protein JJE49_09165, partial [Peptostreptococcaceae bacterium]|nr:hypothetical protein [Peptostreptococcaceae bacterium]
GMGGIRAEGAGRKTIEETNPGVTKALEALVSESTIGNPENPLCGTTKSLRNLEAELVNQGHKISHVKVGELLEGLSYSLQLNKKALQVGEAHVDRDAQFKHINAKARAYGIYDLRENEGYVNVGIRADTAMFAAQSIRTWWEEMGCLKYHGATHLYITSDGGGSNDSSLFSNSSLVKKVEVIWQE